MKALNELTIGIANDHAGVEVKNFIIDNLVVEEDIVS